MRAATAMRGVERMRCAICNEAVVRRRDKGLSEEDEADLEGEDEIVDDGVTEADEELLDNVGCTGVERDEFKDEDDESCCADED